MRVTAASVVADAVRLFRRDRALLLAVAGPFWFLPIYAVELLVPAPPAPPAGGAQSAAWLQAYGEWLAAQGPWYLAAWAIGLWGSAITYSLYLRPDRPDLRAALRNGGRLWPRLLLASAMTGVMAGASFLLAGALIGAVVRPLTMLGTLPALYVFGRLLPAGPALADRQVSALGAISDALRLTRGSGLALAGVVAATLGVGWLLGQPFLLLDAWLRAQGGGNPVAVAIVGAAAAAVAAAMGLFSALLAVAAYRRLAR